MFSLVLDYSSYGTCTATPSSTLYLPRPLNTLPYLCMPQCTDGERSIDDHQRHDDQHVREHVKDHMAQPQCERIQAGVELQKWVHSQSP
jgi:hypothetical protein